MRLRALARRGSLFVVLLIFVCTSFGCESFRKKFIRKPKHEPKPEEMVIVPKDYSKLQLPVGEAYQQYYTYWKAWHNELMTFLDEGKNAKKIISCFDQAILNLNRMKDLLNSENKAGLLNNYIAKMSALETEVKTSSSFAVSMSSFRRQSEQLLRNIQRDFAFSKVKNDLK
jgi:hypothetical protein